MKNSPTIQRKSLSTQVADSIRQMIMSGHFGQGDQLRQEQIAQQLGVSRIPVREAFQQLEAEGLITNLPYKGAVVSQLSEDEIREYFAIRATLESELINEAIDNLTPADLAKARDVHNKMKKASPARWGQLNWELHSIIYDAANRDITLDIIRKIHSNLDRYVRIQLSISDANLEHADAEHELILKLCEEKKKEEATALIRSHVEKARDDLIQHLREHP